MVQKTDPPTAAPAKSAEVKGEAQEKKEGETPSSSTTKNWLEKLKDKLLGKKSTLEMLKEFWKNKDNLSPEERGKQLGMILSAFAFSFIFKKNKKEIKKKAKDKPKKAKGAKAVAEGEEAQEEEEVTTGREKRRKVVCNDARLICINTDPAGSRRPSYLKGKSSYLCEYGLPDYDTFKEEVIYFLAPNASNEKEGLAKAIDALKRSPMGKYQCMPQYLFEYVAKFKKFEFKWKQGGQEEEKLKAMWEFLQSEEMQREACRGYVSETVYALRQDKRFNEDPAYVFASYYGGLSAGKALLARDTNTATAKQRRRVRKPQAGYISIQKYGGKEMSKEEEEKIVKEGKEIKLPKKPPVSIDAIVNQIANKESYHLRNKISKPRDEKWENDQRFAYNRVEQTDDETMIA